MSSPEFNHPMIGNGYYPLNDVALESELADADIIEFNPMFGGFTLILGYRSKSRSYNGKTAQPFICIKNNIAGLPHLFMVKERT